MYKPKKLIAGSNTAPAARLQLNVDPLFDAMDGSYLPGYNGEMILNGGIMNFVGIGGEGNTGKTTIIDCAMLKIMSRHPFAYFNKYETEGNYSPHRMEALAKAYPALKDVDFMSGEDRFQLLSSIEVNGDDWHHILKDFVKEKTKDKSQIGTTPFLDMKYRDKKTKMKTFYPSLFGVDSLSEFQTESSRMKLDKNDIDDKELNTFYANASREKGIMVSEFAKMLPRAGCYVYIVMHVGDTINFGAQPERKRLIHQRQGQKFKGVPKNIEFMTQHCWEIIKAMPLYNSDRSDVLYPISEKEISAEARGKSKTDLMLVLFHGLRNKSGPSGMPMTLIVSQTHGVLWSLSHFHFLKTNKVGMTDNGRTQYLALYPDVALGRTTIRKQIDEDPKLVRALEFSAELCIMMLYRNEYPSEYRMALSDLYPAIIEKGYDWDKILTNTRGYWMFDEEVKETGDKKQYLSGLDLVRLAKGDYEIKSLKKDTK